LTAVAEGVSERTKFVEVTVRKQFYWPMGDTDGY